MQFSPHINVIFQADLRLAVAKHKTCICCWRDVNYVEVDMSSDTKKQLFVFLKVSIKELRWDVSL